MRKNFTVLVVLLMAVLVATPALAAVDFKWGGQFRVRWLGSDNIGDGSDDWKDSDHRIDQRLRLYLTVQASENLKLVVKWEMGDTIWGDARGGVGRGSGGNVGADGVNVELKNAYLDFAIPCTPTRALIGIQGIVLGNSWIVDDDFSAALFVTKLDPFKITAGYIAGQNARDNTDLVGNSLYSYYGENVDDWVVALDYACGPWKANLTFFYQYAHNVAASVLPQSLNTPAGFVQEQRFANASNFFDRDLFNVSSNNFFDLGFSLEYKIDWLKAYVTFVKNLGSVKLDIDDYVAVRGVAVDDFGNVLPRNLGSLLLGGGTLRSRDYTGWMVDAGVYYYCGPWTFNVGGFYTTGPDYRKYTLPFVDARGNFILDPNGNIITASWKALDLSSDADVSWFTYPHAGPSKQSSEIMGGAIFDTGAFPGSYGLDGTNFYRGYGVPTNLWTISVGAAWQVLPKTKLGFSYWYWGASEDVMSGAEIATTLIGGVPTDILVGQKFANDIGHEFNLNLTQGIVDGLTLDVVAAYMITGDAYANSWNGRFIGAENYSKDDAYKLGARLQWNF